METKLRRVLERSDYFIRVGRRLGDDDLVEADPGQLISEEQLIALGFTDMYGCQCREDIVEGWPITLYNMRRILSETNAALAQVKPGKGSDALDPQLVEILKSHANLHWDHKLTRDALYPGKVLRNGKFYVKGNPKKKSRTKPKAGDAMALRRVCGDIINLEWDVSVYGINKSEGAHNHANVIGFCKKLLTWKEVKAALDKRYTPEDIKWMKMWWDDPELGVKAEL